MKWLALLAVLLTPLAARAHPHVFIEHAAVVTGTAAGLTEIRLVWSFDEMFSSTVLHDFDRNKDRKLQPEEIRAIEKGAFANLENYGYFLLLEADGTRVQKPRVAKFDARVVNDQLVYLFSVLLERPAKAVQLTIFDPDYFIVFEPNPERLVQVEAASQAHVRCERVAGGKIDTTYGQIEIERAACSAGP